MLRALSLSGRLSSTCRMPLGNLWMFTMLLLASFEFVEDDVEDEDDDDDDEAYRLVASGCDGKYW